MVLISAHDGYPRWVNAGADFLEIDVRRDEDGGFVLAHDTPHAESRRLSDALDSRAALQLDLKESGYEVELLEEVLNRTPAEDIVVTTPDRESIEKIKAGFPRIRAGLTRTTPERSVADFLALDQRYVDEETLLFCEHNGIPIWIWTVDDIEKLKRYLHDPRIEAVITNRPDLALRIRSGRA